MLITSCNDYDAQLPAYPKTVSVEHRITSLSGSVNTINMGTYTNATESDAFISDVSSEKIVSVKSSEWIKNGIKAHTGSHTRHSRVEI